ncbi:hypothetical protein SY83_04880 [Paenibacillus swuensis]|uniref:SLH domain-containing protein n=1 Tax=Paenibacillus swuensis TaxID=1178515 RepID=A0A172TG31_9BACL|nr:S-layer homology domain-containing protein [Paenibacillus swuensis]ANE45743.1 hypothetical protein SY83_04880 [Paenibacillus swuensis]
MSRSFKWTRVWLSVAVITSMLCTGLTAPVPGGASGIAQAATGGAATTAEAAKPWIWNNIDFQGMGWVTGVAVQEYPPYSLYVRTDVGGAFRYDRDKEEWISITDMFGMDDRGHYEVESINVGPDPANPGVVYMASSGTEQEGIIYKSSDFGATWTNLDVPEHVHIGGNQMYRMNTGERLTVDPNNSDVIYYASREDGVWKRAADGTWSQLGGGLPTNTDTAAEDIGTTFVVMDKNGGVTPQGLTSIFYVGVYDDGVYKTTDGGKTFVKLTAGTAFYEKQPMQAITHEDGTLFVNSGLLQNGTNTTHGLIQTAARKETALRIAYDTATNDFALKQIRGLDIDPSNPDKIVAQTDANDETGLLLISEDKGVTWTTKREVIDFTKDPAFIPSWWSHGSRGPLVIDPANPNAVWTLNGFGVFRIEDITAPQPKFGFVMKGLEELVSNFLRVAPYYGGYDVHGSVMDMGGFSIRDRKANVPSRLVNQKYAGPPTWGITLNQISGMDYSYQKPENMVYVGWHQFSYYMQKDLYFGTTSDGGRTWTESRLPNYGLSGGPIAMSATDPDRLVWSPSEGYVKYSTDRGATWQDASSAFTAGNQMGKLYERITPWWSQTQNLASDKVNGSKFYLFTERNASTAELFMSSDYGQTWQKTYTGFVSTATLPSGEIDITEPNPDNKVNAGALPFTNVRVNPVREGDVFLAVKPMDSHDERAHIYRPLWRSTDATVSDFKTVPNVQAAIDVSFGKGDSPDMPYIYIFGKANGDEDSGVYVSKDDGNTWTRLTNPETQQFGITSGIEADMRYKNRVYLSTDGRGVFYGEPEGLPQIDITAIQSEQVKTGTAYEGLVLEPGANVSIQAEANAAAGSTIEGVEFYNGSQRIGEDVTAPWSLDMTNAAAGDYRITARALDQEGREQHSSARYFRVIQDIETGSVTFSNGEAAPLTALPAGEWLGAEADIKNNASVNREITMEMVLEDAKGKEVDEVSLTQSVEPGQSAPYGTGLELPEVTAGHKVRVYVWSGEERPQGLAPAATIASAVVPEGPKEPKPEEPKPEQPKPEEPKPEQPKPEQPKPEEPKPEQPKPEEPKTGGSGGNGTVGPVTGTTPSSGETLNGTVIQAATPVVTGKAAEVELTADIMLKAIEEAAKAADGSITIRIPAVANANSVLLSIPEQVWVKALENNIARIRIETQWAVMSIRTDAIQVDGKGGSEPIRFSVGVTDSAGKAAEAAQGRTLYAFTAEADGRNITQFNGFKPVIITLNESLKPGDSADKAVVLYVKENGETEIMKSTIVNASKGTVQFAVSHFSAFTLAIQPVSFTDVSDTHWAIRNINRLTVRGITAGTGNAAFQPNQAVTRYEFVRMLTEALELKGKQTTASFPDVKTGAWYSESVSAAASLGLISGYSDGTFRGEDPVTREEMAAFLWRSVDSAERKLPSASTDQAYKDTTDISRFAETAVSGLSKAGILSGDANSLFHPKKSASRAEATAIIDRLMQIED